MTLDGFFITANLGFSICSRRDKNVSKTTVISRCSDGLSPQLSTVHVVNTQKGKTSWSGCERDIGKLGSVAYIRALTDVMDRWVQHGGGLKGGNWGLCVRSEGPSLLITL